MSKRSRKTILLATDQQSSVLNVLNNDRPHPIAYTAYGHRPPGNGMLSLLGFNGELPDPLTGHYHLGKGYRQFNPVLMRINSPDSWSPFGKGGLNAYAYCDGEPVLGRDPTGHNNVFKSTWKAFQNRFMGRIPKRQRHHAAVPKNSAVATPTPLPPPEKAFDIDALTPEEIKPNFLPIHSSVKEVQNLSFPIFVRAKNHPAPLLRHLNQSRDNLAAQLSTSSPEHRLLREGMLNAMEADIHKTAKALNTTGSFDALTAAGSQIRAPRPM